MQQSNNTEQVLQQHAFSLCENAKVIFNAGNFAEALRLFNAANQLFPQIQNLQYARAYCFFQLGRYAEAKLAIETELQMQPDNQEYVKLLHQILAELHKNNPMEKNIFNLIQTTGDYFKQIVRLSVWTGQGRLSFFRRFCENKRVLHIGCSDAPFEFNPNTSLHYQLSQYCKTIDGFDTDTQNFSKMASVIHGNYYNDISQLKEHEWDVCLIPEVLEYVDNIKNFCETIFHKVNAKTYIMTAPNAFCQFNHENSLLLNKNVYSECVHPDHKVWFSPYTLINCIRKYIPQAKIQEAWLIENQRIIAVYFSRQTAYRKKMKIGLLVIATGKYIKLVPLLWESVKKYFMKKHDVTMFVFTDSKEFTPEHGQIKIEQQHTPWPGPTLLRYRIFKNNEKYFQEMDYLFYCDADMLFVSDVGDEILSDLIGTYHPGFYDRQRQDFTYETNPNSKAYISPNEGIIYFCGGFHGGKREQYMKMISELADNIDNDLKQGIIAIWHDESHLNRYFINKPPTLTLTPSYAYPESWWHLPFERKILALDKNHSEMRS